MISGKAPHLELFFHQHAYGKPKEQHEHSGTVNHRVYAWQE